MAEQQSPAEWRVMGETVPGASHLRAGVPNQDAILQARESGRGLPVIVSISDGHGSNKCFRSDRGSRFAVKAAARVVGEFLDDARGLPNHAEVEGKAKDFLPREFVRRWREAAEADLKARPFTEDELGAVEKRDGPRARKLVEENPLLAYGATSLTVAVADSFALCLQLGDGEILNVSAAGAVARALPEDARLFANETTSLCTPDAEKNFRVRLQPMTDEPPALILLSTDGYVNSFSDSAGFLKVGSDLLEMLREDGFDPVSASLKGWLEEATRSGSGDDCTVAIICRMDALRKAEEAPGTKAAGSASVEVTTGVSAAPATAAEGAAAAARGQDEAPEQSPASGVPADSAEPVPTTKPDGRGA
ncbi:MAG TPA: PP2C family serine/threonine-protein phosphatase [Pyrinomonadaceae bacterium]